MTQETTEWSQEEIDTEADHVYDASYKFVNDKGRLGRKTRGLIGGILGLQKLGFVGRGLTYALGLKKSLRKATYGKKNNDSFDMLVAQYRLLKEKEKGNKYKRETLKANPGNKGKSLDDIELDAASKAHIEDAELKARTLSYKMALKHSESPDDAEDTPEVVKAETAPAVKKAEPVKIAQPTAKPIVKNDAISKFAPQPGISIAPVVAKADVKEEPVKDAAVEAVKDVAPEVTVETVAPEVMTTAVVSEAIPPVVNDIVAETPSTHDENVVLQQEEPKTIKPYVYTLPGRDASKERLILLTPKAFEAFLNQEAQSTPAERQARNQERIAGIQEKWGAIEAEGALDETALAEKKSELNAVVVLNHLSDNIDVLDAAYTEALGLYSGRLDIEQSTKKDTVLVNFFHRNLAANMEHDNLHLSMTDIAIGMDMDIGASLKAENKLTAKAHQGADIVLPAQEPTTIELLHATARSTLLPMDKHLEIARQQLLDAAAEQAQITQPAVDVAESPAEAIRYVRGNGTSPTIQLNPEGQTDADVFNEASEEALVSAEPPSAKNLAERTVRNNWEINSTGKQQPTQYRYTFTG